MPLLPAPIVGLFRRLVRPLWVPSPSDRSRLRCRLMAGLPFVGLGGFVWGFFSAPVLGLAEPFPWGLLGAAAFSTFFYLQNRLEPVVRGLSRHVGAGLAGPVLWDVAAVGGLTLLLTDVLGAPAVPAVTTALLAGAAYTWGLDYVLCGAAARHVSELLIPTRGGGVPYRDQHSLAAALVARGEIEAAMEAYRDAIRKNPRDLVPYVRLARTMSDEAGRHEDSVRILRAALRDARLDERQEAFVVRQIEETWSQRAREPVRAAPDLARFLDRNPDSGHAAWARQTLDRIKMDLRVEEAPLDRPGPPSDE